MIFLEIPNVPKGTVFAEKVTFNGHVIEPGMETEMERNQTNESDNLEPEVT